jgi:hypothetical protein
VRLWLAGLALAFSGLAGVAGCGPATLTPFDSDPPEPSRPPVATPVASASPTDLLAEMEVRSLDAELTDTILTFASDGQAVLFSSGAAEDAERGAAPDLWRADAFSDDAPEVLWRNPARDHAIVKVAGDLGTVAFVDIPLDGSRAWDLWLIPRDTDKPILLDTHPGDESVSSLVPSFGVAESTVAWTAFDIGPDGPVSQLLWARGPRWEPELLLERPAARAELWFPSLGANSLVYSEVRYSDDRESDTRSVYVLPLAQTGAEPVRLGDSDRATMPVVIGTTVIWKEADPGFSMFNWGRLWRTELDGPGPRRLDTEPADYVNYPSAGSRFVTWWSADAFTFGVYDIVEDRPRVIETYAGASGANVVRPHIAWDLLTWLYLEGESPESRAELRYAVMPPVRAPR